MKEIQYKSTVDVELIQSVGGDAMVIAAARVSTNGTDAVAMADLPPEDNAGLINYLMKQRHGSPFEHSSMTFFVHAPIFVWREWHRHRIGFCLAGDSVVDFVDVNGTRAKGICRTVKQLYDRWEHGEVNGSPANEERLEEAMELVAAGVSVRAASAKTGVSRGAITRRRNSSMPGARRGSRWRVEGMRLRVLDEESQFFTQGSIADVVQSGVKELIAVEAGGRRLRCSRDHRVYTEDGWMPAGELRQNDRVAVVGKRSRFQGRQIPPSLRSGIGVWTSMQRNALIQETDRCYICGGEFHKSQLVLDHVVPVVADLQQALNTANLKPACEECHRIKTNSEQKLAQRGCVAGSRFVRLKSTPRACGEEMTYDISVNPPHHNFVANGIVVHNSYNEESGRYKELEPIFYLPDRDRPMMKVDGWKPGRPKFLKCEEADTFNSLCDNLKDSYRYAYEMYQQNLALGIDPGLARDCLPVGIYSGCWVTCNPRSLMAFLSLRTHEPDAAKVSYPLWEIELGARACEEIFAKGWPLTYKAFCDNGRAAP